MFFLQQSSWRLRCFGAVFLMIANQGVMAIASTTTPRSVLATETSAPAELTSTLSAQVTVLDRLPPSGVARVEPAPRSGRKLVSEISVTAKPISVGRSAGIDDRLEEQSLAALFPQIYSRLSSGTQRNSVAQENNSPERLWNLLGQSLLERRKEHTRPPTPTTTTSTTTSTTTTTTRRPTTARPTRAEKKAEKPKDVPSSLLPQLLEELRDNAEIKDVTVRQLHRRVLFDMIRMALGSNGSLPLGPLHRTVVMSDPDKVTSGPAATSSTTTSTSTTSTTTTSTTPEPPSPASSEEFFEEVHREGFVDVEHVGPDRVCLFYKGRRFLPCSAT